MLSTNVWERRVSLFKKHCLGFFLAEGGVKQSHYVFWVVLELICGPGSNASAIVATS